MAAVGGEVMASSASCKSLNADATIAIRREPIGTADAYPSQIDAEGRDMSAMDDWVSLWTSPWTMTRTILDTAETLIAAQSVVAARSGIIATALSSPHLADRKELRLMISEKTAAFNEAGRTFAKDTATVRSGMDRYRRDLGRLAEGKAISPFEYWAIWGRAVSTAVTMLDMPGRALKPVHRTATANARRLR